jgi:hypothetical protein
MFAKTIVLSDAFLDMPLSARCLYFTLGMFADDDGFVNGPKSIIRQCGASEDDLKVLVAKRFVLPFESGVIVIKHWRINNYLQKDRYKETKYLNEKSQLVLEKNGAYSECIHSNCIPSIGKYRLDKDIEKESIEKKAPSAHRSQKFIPPTVDEVRAYCTERKNNVNPERFVDFYSSKGWMVGKNRMKDWKACVRTWEQRDKQEKGSNKSNHSPTFDIDEYERESIYDTKEAEK